MENKKNDENKYDETFKSKIEYVNWTPDLITSFQRIDYQRPISPNHVQKIKETISSGGTLIKPIVISRHNTHTMLLDGYHRFEALKSIGLPSYPIKLEVYNNLSEEEEIEVYDNYNNVKNHSGEDILRPYIKNIDFFKYVNLDFPVPIVDGQRFRLKGISFYYLALAVYCAKVTPQYSKNAVKEFARKSLSISDYENIKSFFKSYVGYFGAYNPSSIYWKPLVWMPIYLIFQEENLFNNQARFMANLKIYESKSGEIVKILTNFSNEGMRRMHLSLKQWAHKGKSIQNRTII